jgi:hypothetical protein
MWMPGRHLYVEASRSALSHPVLDATGGQCGGAGQGRDTIVAQLPHRSVGIPRPAGLLHSLPGRDIGERDPQRNDLVGRKPRLPCGLGDDQLHGLDPPLPCGVVAVPYADKAVSVLFYEMLRALLARLEVETDRCGGRGDGCRRGVRGRGRRRVTASGMRAELPAERLPSACPPRSAETAIRAPASHSETPASPWTIAEPRWGGKALDARGHTGLLARGGYHGVHVSRSV